MSNSNWNKSTANSRDASGKKIGHYGRGHAEIPKPVKAGAITTKGIAPTSEGKASGGHPRSRKGIPAKGFRTRSKSKESNKYIIERRNK